MIPAGSVRSLVDFFLPAACLGCRTRIPLDRPEERVCLRCRSRLRSPSAPLCRRCGVPAGTGIGRHEGPCSECREWPAILGAARSAVVLEPPADALVHALKYGGWGALSRHMGRRMADTFTDHFGSDEEAVVVPVPTTRTRERRRGYNQAASLAGVVAERLGVPLSHALRRRSGGRTQVALHPLERADNVRRAFAPHGGGGGAPIQDRRVILVDDVLTTGATGCAAAGALEKARARSVVLLTFARALPFR